MLTCTSPRKVMLVAHHLASQVLPPYSGKFSRHDFTLAQLFACLCAKELLKRSYRGAEAVLRDAEHWCRAIGMRKVPDHNTLCRAAAVLMGRGNADKVLDAGARCGGGGNAEKVPGAGAGGGGVDRARGLSLKPLAGDSSLFELRHVSRH